jgi:hypothetical protein
MRNFVAFGRRRTPLVFGVAVHWQVLFEKTRDGDSIRSLSWRCGRRRRRSPGEWDVLGAIVAGVAAANDEARSCGLDHIGVGVNTTPLFGPSSGFYAKLVGIGGQALIDGLSYIGLDMFPDVFRPVPDGDVGAATRGLLANKPSLEGSSGSV